MSGVARIFLRPNGDKFIDFPMGDGVTIGAVVNILKFEGGLWGEHAYIPADTVHYIVTVGTPEQPSRPNLMPFPGGKEGA